MVSISRCARGGSVGLSIVVGGGSLVHQAQSYVVGGNPGAEGILSRFTNVECDVLMTVGRTPNTEMREYG